MNLEKVKDSNMSVQEKNGNFIIDSIKAAFLSAIAVFFSGLIPIFGIFLLFISIIPQMVLFTNKRNKQAFLSWLILVIILYIYKGAGFTLSYTAIFFIWSGLYLELIKKTKTPHLIILNASICWAVIVFLWVGLYYLFLKINLLKELVTFIKMSGAISIGKYYDIGFPYSQIEIIDRSVQGFIDFLIKGSGGWMIIIGVFGTWINYSVLSRNILLQKLPSMAKFRFPDNCIWVLICSVLLYMLGRSIPGNNIILLTSINLGIVLLCGYFLSGFGLVFNFMNKLNVPTFMKFIIIIFLFIFLKGLYLFLLLGLVDVWVDFRKKMKLKNERSSK